MRVCMFAPELLPNRGGVGSYCVGLIRELSRQVELTVLTPKWHLGEETFSAKEIEEAFDGRIRVETLSEARDSFLYNPRFQWALLKRARRLMREERFDAFHAHHAHMPDVLARPLHPGARTIRTVHSTIGGQRMAIRQARGLGGPLAVVDRWQVLLEPVLRRAERGLLAHHDDYFLGVSRWTQEQLIGLGIPRSRLGLAPCGVDSGLFSPEGGNGDSPRSAEAPPTVIFGGRPTMIRGAAVLAAAIPRVVGAFPEARFVITGSTPRDFPGIESMPERVRSHIRFTGHIAYSDLPAVYRAAHVAVAPTYYDNLPIRVLEAMAMGLPVVASSVGGIPEVVLPGRTGLLVSPGDAAQLADGVIRLLGDEKLARAMGEAGRALVRSSFTWSLAAEATRRAYESAWAVNARAG